MLKKLFTSALFAGFGAGLLAAVLQIFIAVPVILEAELYESGVEVHYAGVFERAAPDHSDGHGAAAQANDAAREAGEPVEPEAPAGMDWPRHIQTFLSMEMNFIGYAFLMIAGMALAARSGVVTTARSGILWGMAGFIAFSLAPALGLPPELPGAMAAPLELRQMWWIGTVLATTAALVAFAFGSNWMHWGAGIVLLALPHIIGFPKAGGYGGVVPPELAGEFVGMTLAISAISWAVLGLLAGYFWAKEEA